ncbi:MAG: ABC transporter permease, partial [Pseudomonadota bacterium]
MGSSTLRIAWRNLGRNRRRTALALGAIALGQATVIFVNSMMASTYEDMFKTITGPLVGHVQIHHRQWREERSPDLTIESLDDTMTAVSSLPRVTRVSARVYAPVLAAAGEKSEEPVDAEPAMIVGVDVAAEAKAGGLLEGIGTLPDEADVVVGKVLAKRLGVARGERLAVVGQDGDGMPVSELYRVARIVSGKTDVVNRLGIVMPIAKA